VVLGGRSKLGYLFRWNEYLAPKALYQLQKEGLLTRVSTREFRFKIDGKEESFSYGTILIPGQGQKRNESDIFELVSRIAKATGIDFYGLDTSLSSHGPDLGSNSFVALDKPRILMLIGGTTSSRDAGEIWHLFDQRYQIPVCLTESDGLEGVDLNRYNVILMPPGSYREINNSAAEKIKRWTAQGGTLVTLKNAALWAARNEIGKTTFKKSVQSDSIFQPVYADRNKESTLHAIGGSIFKTETDLTHPLCYGYLNKELPVFKTGNAVAEPLGIRYAEPVHFSEEPYISGYVSQQNLERIKNAPVVSIHSSGRGKRISYYESMTFRGIWAGTNKLFMNAVFFGNTIR